MLGINTYELKTNAHALATPSEQMSWVVGQLKEFGAVKGGWLGVNIQVVTKEIAEALNTKPGGALVASVANKGAAKTAGVEEGDVITAIDGREVKDPHQLARVVGMMSPSQIVELSIVRGGNEMKKVVTPGLLSQPASTPAAVASAQPTARTADAPKQPAAPPPGATKIIGLGVVDLNDRLGANYRIASNATGVLIVTSDFEKEKGLKPGDIITEVSGSPVSSVADFGKDIGVLRSSGKKTVLLLVSTDGAVRFVALNVQ